MWQQLPSDLICRPHVLHGALIYSKTNPVHFELHLTCPMFYTPRLFRSQCDEGPRSQTGGARRSGPQITEVPQYRYETVEMIGDVVFPFVVDKSTFVRPQHLNEHLGHLSVIQVTFTSRFDSSATGPSLQLEHFTSHLKGFFRLKGTSEDVCSLNLVSSLTDSRVGWVVWPPCIWMVDNLTHATMCIHCNSPAMQNSTADAPVACDLTQQAESLYNNRQIL